MNQSDVVRQNLNYGISTVRHFIRGEKYKKSQESKSQDIVDIMREYFVNES